MMGRRSPTEQWTILQWKGSLVLMRFVTHNCLSLDSPCSLACVESQVRNTVPGYPNCGRAHRKNWCYSSVLCSLPVCNPAVHPIYSGWSVNEYLGRPGESKLWEPRCHTWFVLSGKWFLPTTGSNRRRSPSPRAAIAYVIKFTLPYYLSTVTKQILRGRLKIKQLIYFSSKKINKGRDNANLHHG